MLSSVMASSGRTAIFKEILFPMLSLPRDANLLFHHGTVPFRLLEHQYIESSWTQGLVLPRAPLVQNSFSAGLIPFVIKEIQLIIYKSKRLNFQKTIKG
jgi:hypothetical protein